MCTKKYAAYFSDRFQMEAALQGFENQNAQDGVAFVYHCVVATIRWYDA
jgi:hypothetical protein